MNNPIDTLMHPVMAYRKHHFIDPEHFRGQLDRGQLDGVTSNDLVNTPRLIRNESQTIRRVRNMAVAALLTLGIGVGVGSLDDYNDSQAVDDHYAAIEEAQEDAEIAEEQALQTELEAETQRERVTSQLGETCTAFLGDYMPGRQLADVSESALVRDALDTPGQPCGDRPADIRSDYRDLSELEETLLENSQETFSADNDRVSTLQAQTADILADDADKSQGLGVVGVGLSLVVAGLAVRWTRSKETYRQFRLAKYIRKHTPVRDDIINLGYRLGGHYSLLGPLDRRKMARKLADEVIMREGPLEDMKAVRS